MSLQQQDAETSDAITPPEQEEFHPTSKWQEPMGTEENGDLTLYDLHRKARTIALTTTTTPRLRIPLKLLHSDLRCPICMSYLHETVMVKECMHRFCRRCIIDCISKGKKECPTCRIHLPSKRYLRADERFDVLVRDVLGNAQEQDESELRHLQQVNNMSVVSRGSRVVPVTRRSTSSSRKTSGNKRQKVVSPGEQPKQETRRPKPLSRTSARPIEGFEPSPLVQFLLVRHADETTLEPLLKDSIQTSGEAPVSVVETFLSKKLSTPGKVQILIGMRNNDGDKKCVVLHPTLQLGQVQQEFCATVDETMVLYYRLK